MAINSSSAVQALAGYQEITFPLPTGNTSCTPTQDPAASKTAEDVPQMQPTPPYLTPEGKSGLQTPTGGLEEALKPSISAQQMEAAQTLLDLLSNPWGLSGDHLQERPQKRLRVGKLSPTESNSSSPTLGSPFAPATGDCCDDVAWAANALLQLMGADSRLRTDQPLSNPLSDFSSPPPNSLKRKRANGDENLTTPPLQSDYDTDTTTDLLISTGNGNGNGAYKIDPRPAGTLIKLRIPAKVPRKANNNLQVAPELNQAPEAQAEMVRPPSRREGLRTTRRPSQKLSQKITDGEIVGAGERRNRNKASANAKTAKGRKGKATQ